MSAFLGYFVSLLYFKYVSQKGLDGKLNKANFIVSVSAMFGIMLVGNFQFVNLIIVHFFGAFLAFCGIIAVEFMVGVITYKLLFPRWLYCLRFVQGKFGTFYVRCYLQLLKDVLPPVLISTLKLVIM